MKKDGDHKKVLSAAGHKELQKISKYQILHARLYPSTPVGIKPHHSVGRQDQRWSLPKIRGLANLCATVAESNADPGCNPKLKAELTSEFMYNIICTIWLNNADMMVNFGSRIVQILHTNLVEVLGVPHRPYRPLYHHIIGW